MRPACAQATARRRVRHYCMSSAARKSSDSSWRLASLHVYIPFESRHTHILLGHQLSMQQWPLQIAMSCAGWPFGSL